jgi:hypothetical protein
MEENHRR